MREIKFRAWDKRNSEIYIPYFTEFNDMNDEISNIQDDGVELMQYTGLKDKNGVEIYEGDIVNYLTRAVSHLDGIIWTGRVMYQYGAFRLCRNLHNNIHSEGMGYGFPYEYEVIGNIYESPDLLEEKQ